MERFCFGESSLTQKEPVLPPKVGQSWVKCGFSLLILKKMFGEFGPESEAEDSYATLTHSSQTGAPKPGHSLQQPGLSLCVDQDRYQDQDQTCVLGLKLG